MTESVEPVGRILILGNSGSGKTTMAKGLGLPHLDMDTIAWSTSAGGEPVRRPMRESIAELEAFMASHPHWVIEGSYADLAAVVAKHCTEFRLLNPRVEACIAHCKARSWEPEKYATRAEQDANLAMLLEWVRRYPTRDDEFGLAQHRAVFDAFVGVKREYCD